MIFRQVGQKIEVKLMPCRDFLGQADGIMFKQGVRRKLCGVAFMLPLSRVPYEPAVWKQTTVRYDYLVSDGQNKYSVPFDLIGEQVQIRLTKNTL